MIKRVLVVFGTRPEVIKLAPLVYQLKNRSDIHVTTCATAQHRELLDQILGDFSFSPDIDLDLMTPGQSLEQLTANILTRVSTILEMVKVDAVIVQGDTTTAYAVSLAAFYKQIPIAHVEAGLRTYDIQNPFPEELYRQTISKMAHWHFAPSAMAKQNLLNEGIESKQIWVTGNTSIDALLHALSSKIPEPQMPTKPYILVTAHRRENIGQGMKGLVTAIHELATSRPEFDFLISLHPNPKAHAPFKEKLSALDNVILSPALGYKHFVQAMKHCTFILSDSGGVQEEAPALGKPVLVLRDKTERSEALAAGTIYLVGTQPEKIVRAVNHLLSSPDCYQKMVKATNPYGNGKAAQKMADALATNWPSSEVKAQTQDIDAKVLVSQM
ncbi:MAG: UDP-N-acetylglucosamine 2-epimerase (non-hydrolyzing) [Sphingomonadales bacterium]|jgi:UDP-N-acetylglucosamine 2-epimerase (non-hydrolysing)